MILQQRLKGLRQQRKVTQQDVATAIGITPRNVQNFEYGTTSPSLQNAARLADFFNVSLDYLVGRSNNPARLP